MQAYHKNYGAYRPTIRTMIHGGLLCTQPWTQAYLVPNGACRLTLLGYPSIKNLLTSKKTGGIHNTSQKNKNDH